MGQQSPVDAASERISSALNAMEDENPHLKGVLQAFRGLLIEQARWKVRLPAPECTDIGPPDPEQFGKGVSLTDRAQLSRLGDLWPVAAEQIFPALIAGFPKIQPGLVKLQADILQKHLAPDDLLSALFGGMTAEVNEQVKTTGLTPELLEFALTQAARPYVEKRAETLAARINDLTWHKGYCPICGSLPGLSLLKEKEGQRWLRCSFCAHMWRFQRTTCPFCEAQGPYDIELTYVEGLEHERIEACQQCRKYLTGIDLRNLANEVVLEAAGFGLLHLDAIAQKKGYLPMIGRGTCPPSSEDRGLQVS